MDIISYSGSGNKFTINPANALIAYASNGDISNKNFDTILSELKAFVTSEAAMQNGIVSEGSFNKCNGDWYEWLIGIRAIEVFLGTTSNRLLVKMPNASSFDVISLYKSNLSQYIYDLRYKLNFNQVNLITSNPDFSIIDIGEEKNKYAVLLQHVSMRNISISTLNTVDNLFREFVSYADLDQVTSFLSVKTTFRPDRRLQLAHEGSLMKALYTHLQTRTWTINPRGIKYYAAATHVGNADITGLKTVATHSITDVKSLPQSAVDEIFRINSVQDVDNCLHQILFN